MKIVIISDIHGNSEALTALDETYDELWALGDLVDYGPDPSAVIDYVKSKASVAVRGNHDLARRTGSFVAHSDACRVCQEQAKVQDQVLTKLLEAHAGANHESHRNLPALCLPRLSALLRKSPDSSLRASLLAFEAALFERLAENMERYGLKHDALRRGFVSEDERIAYHRGLSYLVGDKRLTFSFHVDYLL